MSNLESHVFFKLFDCVWFKRYLFVSIFIESQGKVSVSYVNTYTSCFCCPKYPSTILFLNLLRTGGWSKRTISYDKPAATFSQLLGRTADCIWFQMPWCGTSTESFIDGKVWSFFPGIFLFILFAVALNADETMGSMHWTLFEFANLCHLSSTDGNYTHCILSWD